MTEREELIGLLNQALEAKGLVEKPYQDRLAAEMKEIDAQTEHHYFLDLHRKRVRYAQNQHNLLVPFLLDIVKDFDITKTPAYSYGEFPDIDVDYLPMVRDYLKNEWAAKTFGQEKVS